MPRLTIERTTDLDVIKSIMTHPYIYPRLAEDGAPPPEAFTPTLHNCVYLLGRCDDRPFALGIYGINGSVTWDTHVAVIPTYRRHAYDFAKAAQDWAFDYAQKLTARIPFNYPDTMRFGLKLGWKIEGVCERSVMKGGELVDCWYLGLSKPNTE